jgi:hypothetical protein
MSRNEVVNAAIEGVSIGDDEHGAVTAWLYLKLETGCQGFGGYGLYNYGIPLAPSYLGLFVERCMEIGGVDKWERLVGKSIRIAREGGMIVSIGHLLESKWFTPKAEFEKVEKASGEPLTVKEAAFDAAHRGMMECETHDGYMGELEKLRRRLQGVKL